MSPVTKIVVLAVVLSAVVGGVVFAMNGGDDTENEETTQADDFISFYLYDNYQYDNTSGVLSQNTHIADGIWVKGRGDTKEAAFRDACRTAGIPVVVSGGYISSWNGITDGNFSQQGWVKNQWTTDIHLSSDETFSVRYMAIGHGRWSNGSGGSPPTPQQTPDDIRWYWGESMKAGSSTAVTFRFYDDYRYDPDPSYAYMASSTTSKFVADGYNVTGYGDTVEAAFRDACKRCFGDNVVIAYNSNNGVINRIGTVSGNLNTLVWNGSAWTGCDMSAMSLTSGLTIAVCHGPTSDLGEIPDPGVSGSDLGWAL